jgi:hypothetical protein
VLSNDWEETFFARQMTPEVGCVYVSLTLANGEDEYCQVLISDQ